MQIKSNFKDYYDHVPHVYGNGGDPKVTYVRGRIKDMEIFYGSKTPHDYPFSVDINKVHGLPDLNIKGDNIRVQPAWLVIAGRYVPIVRSYEVSDPDHDFGPSPFKDELDSFYVVGKNSSFYDKFMNPHGRYLFSENYTVDPDKQYPELIELSKTIGHPVFVIIDVNYNNIRVSRKCPTLARLGVQHIMSAEQIYQELYYFLGNVIKPSPDMMPAPKPPMTDKERILSHGFDVKKSFRHRKG